MTTTTPQAALLSDDEVAQCINRARTNLFDRAGTTSFRIARAIEQAVIAKLQATREPVQAGELPDERAAFEAEMRCSEEWGHRSLKKRTNGKYENWQVDLMWDVWQARAALSARKPLKALSDIELTTAYANCPLDNGLDEFIASCRRYEEWRGIGLEVKP